MISYKTRNFLSALYYKLKNLVVSYRIVKLKEIPETTFQIDKKYIFGKWKNEHYGATYLAYDAACRHIVYKLGIDSITMSVKDADLGCGTADKLSNQCKECLEIK